MKKGFIIYDFVRKMFYCGDYGAELEWQTYFYYSEFYSEKEDAEMAISKLSEGAYQIIELYRN